MVHNEVYIDNLVICTRFEIVIILLKLVGFKV